MAVSRQDLDELYSTGKEFDASPDQDGSVMLFMRKLGPTEHQKAVKKANAARIRKRTLLDRQGEIEDDEIVVLREEAAQMDRAEKIQYLVEVEIAPEKAKIEQELSEEEEWAEDGKLQSLVDSWENDGMMEEWLKGEGERSEESEAIWNELKAFSEAIEEKMEGRRSQAKEEYEDKTDEELEDDIIETFLEREAGLTWLTTFREYQILYGVEDIDSEERIYKTIDHVANIPIELWTVYVKAIDDMAIPATELKS